jgi:hypothetical protein
MIGYPHTTLLAQAFLNGQFAAVNGIIKQQITVEIITVTN